MLTEIAVRVAKADDASIGDDSDNDETKPTGPRVKRVQVTLLSPPARLTHISFQNYYTASLRVDQVLFSGKTTCVVANLSLMAKAHYEDDAQNWHVLKLDQLPGLDAARATGFVLYLTQPSPLWDKVCQMARITSDVDRSGSSGSCGFRDHRGAVHRTTRAARKAAELTDGQLFRKYTINTSGTVSADAKHIRNHAATFLDLLSLVHRKLHV
ncbi:hypothetical protein SPRG_02820 [Saprolegnia parasitica CBS 223.65]|uniref:Uncharacterized protein n=1 Tax=Saprolegnia parasitica (strain CBS 223.65) TaxID=695850 RepID=A0A067D0Q1_SAPPC|nr:hypothetical protein SPRG_02820 [Saprolegnia parasitica CBS 223.65]KDO32341.1 hypothetical protein SPRG_02820 [Saprolegnia parasitica CBS 223.65]|eukprot:XP_012196797.1 hypothetical protein SPRG_02820 [Saprolegnia parasitica CBS 223.65]